MFFNCIGLIDGTLIPLAFAPMVNGEDYYTRKGDYAIKGLVICDDAARITWVEMGWPGSVHNTQKSEGVFAWGFSILDFGSDDSSLQERP